MKKRVLVKISGAAIQGDGHEIHNLSKIENICKQLIALSKVASVGIVLGGGNIWRGNMTKNHAFRRANADYMGMLSTVLNGLAFQETFARLGAKSEIYSALNVCNVTNPLSVHKLNKDLNAGNILIFTGGTGHPYFTTDTACALRAIDMSANIILMGKNGVDGVYSDDPKKNKKAKFYKELTFLDAVAKQLKVMDLSAMTLCNDNNIDIYVFDIDAKDGIIKTFKKQSKFTYVHK